MPSASRAIDEASGTGVGVDVRPTIESCAIAPSPGQKRWSVKLSRPSQWNVGASKS